MKGMTGLYISVIIMALLFIISAQAIFAKHDRVIEQTYYDVRKELYK